MAAIKVYTSAKLAHAESLRKLQPDGFHFNARWLWMAEGQRKSLKPVSDWKEENRDDIVAAHFFLLKVDPSDDLSGSIEEVGYAIGKDKRVWIAGNATSASDENWGVEVEVPGMAPRLVSQPGEPEVYEPGKLRIPHKQLVPWGFDRRHIRMVPNVTIALKEMRQFVQQSRVLNAAGAELPKFEF